ncbi:MAG TPA: hypothetical protein VGW74_19460, partial [Propionibacteriaceae bacterium]|nr:hypothetical protein [Propionibacteriaceae bacterium]
PVGALSYLDGLSRVAIEPNIVAEIEALIIDLAESGMSVLLVKQYVSFALNAATGYADKVVTCAGSTRQM